MVDTPRSAAKRSVLRRALPRTKKGIFWSSFWASTLQAAGPEGSAGAWVGLGVTCSVPGDGSGEYPGVYPYTRGPYASMYRSKLWTMRMFAGFGTAEDTNWRFKEIIRAGGDGLSTAFDMPTLLGLDKLLEAQVLLAPPERRADLDLIKNLIHAHTRRVARYRCDDCGFKARQFHWRCPACGGWETFPPKRTEEFDLTP